MKVKAHLVIPKEILDEVDQIAGKRGRSLFITEAALEKLERERFLKVLEETRGAWADKRHTDLRSSADLENYLNIQRSDPGSGGRYYRQHLSSEQADFGNL